MPMLHCDSACCLRSPCTSYSPRNEPSSNDAVHYADAHGFPACTQLIRRLPTLLHVGPEPYIDRNLTPAFTQRKSYFMLPLELLTRFLTGFLFTVYFTQMTVYSSTTSATVTHQFTAHGFCLFVTSRYTFAVEYTTFTYTAYLETTLQSIQQLSVLSHNTSNSVQIRGFGQTFRSTSRSCYSTRQSRYSCPKF
jgi:hypothetical protein